MLQAESPYRFVRHPGQWLLPGKIVSRNVNVPWKADNGKSIRELGVSYRPLEESLNEMFQQMIDNDVITK
jgi:dihydroflavonol-4-reductase